MRTRPGGRGDRCLSLATLIAILTLINCGGGDDTQSPGGGNGKEEVVLSAKNASDWQGNITRTHNTDSRCSPYDIEHPSIASILSNGVFRIEANSHPSGTCCVSETYHVQIETTDVVDLTPYKAARFKATITLYCQRYVAIGGYRAIVRIYLRSHVPGSNGLTLMNYNFYANTSGETREVRELDLSLENALNLSEASITMDIQVFGGCGGYDTLVANQAFAQVANLRIVASK